MHYPMVAYLESNVIDKFAYILCITNIQFTAFIGFVTLPQYTSLLCSTVSYKTDEFTRGGIEISFRHAKNMIKVYQYIYSAESKSSKIIQSIHS